MMCCTMFGTNRDYIRYQIDQQPRTEFDVGMNGADFKFAALQ